MGSGKEEIEEYVKESPLTSGISGEELQALLGSFGDDVDDVYQDQESSYENKEDEDMEF
jgi:hypothetical protein